MVNSTISGNSAAEGGGGIFNNGTLTITNLTISGNSANDAGGGVFDNGTSTITNSTISGNSARESSSSGGGIYISSGTTVLANCIVSLNAAPAYGDVYGSLGAGSGYILIGVDPGFVHNPGSGNDGIWGTGDDVAGDLHLRHGSPAINAGSNALAVDADGNPLVTDLDGKDRIIYGTVDIGAYEYRLPGDANLDAMVNDKDASLVGSHWQQQSGATWAMGDFNADGVVNDRDAAILAAHWGASVEQAAEEDFPGTSVPTEPVSPAQVRPIGPVLPGTSAAPRRRIEPVPSSHAAAEARSETAPPEQAAARHAIFAETSNNDSDGQSESLRYRLAWSYELGRVHGHRCSSGRRDPEAHGVDELLALGMM